MCKFSVSISILKNAYTSCAEKKAKVWNWKRQHEIYTYGIKSNEIRDLRFNHLDSVVV